MSYFNYTKSVRMTSSKFHNLFNAEPRIPESELTQKHMDIASSIQKVTEEIILKIVNNIAQVTHEKNLCLAGGVALNCVANAAIKRSNLLKIYGYSQLLVMPVELWALLCQYGIYIITKIDRFLKMTQ